MTSRSPPPNSPPISAVPPAFSNTPPQPSSPPPPPQEQPVPPPPQEQPLPPVQAPPSQPNDTPPGGPALPSAPPISPPTASPPPPPVTSPPPPQSSPPNPPSPPPASPPMATPPPPPVTSPPANVPPPANAPPPSSPPSNPSTPPPNLTPPSSAPPISPPPPPTTNPPSSSPPPPSSDPPTSPPPPPSANPPPSSPPPPSSDPPTSPPPPPSTNPPRNSPPPPSSTPPSSPPPPVEPPKSEPPPTVPPKPPESSPPPPSSQPPKSSPPPPLVEPPRGSPPPPPTPETPPNSPPSPPPSIPTTPPSDTPLPPSSPPRLLSPPPDAQLSPPPSLGSQPSPFPSSPSLVPPTTNSPDSSNSPGGGDGIGTGGIVGIGLALGLLLLGLIGIAVWCIQKRKKKASRIGSGYVLPTSQGSSPNPQSALSRVQVSATTAGTGSTNDSGSSPSPGGGLGNSKSWFTYEELAEATNAFSVQNLLGEGGFGSVYKGCLSDGREVAVKQLKVGGGQGDREFRAEVEIISRVHHRHLVSLVGYCISDSRRLLVYEYVPNDTLHFHLHGNGRPVLNWATRVKIAVGAARGIAYLHEDCHPRIIHRDIKSSNILLDNNFEAKVSDFGLAKLILDTTTHVTTRVMGTFGYMAPEYASSGKLTEKSDVFSFGVVLLELITGRKPVDTSQPLGDESLVEWSRPLLSHALETEEFEALVDPRLEKNYVGSQMFRMIEAAAACVRHSSTKRPRITQVVRAFDDMSTTDLTNGMRVGESEMFNSAQQSAEIRLFRRMAFGSHNFSTDFFSQATTDSEEKGEDINNLRSGVSEPLI